MLAIGFLREAVPVNLNLYAVRFVLHRGAGLKVLLKVRSSSREGLGIETSIRTAKGWTW